MFGPQATRLHSTTFPFFPLLLVLSRSRFRLLHRGVLTSEGRRGGELFIGSPLPTAGRSPQFPNLKSSPWSLLPVDSIARTVPDQPWEVSSPQTSPSQVADGHHWVAFKLVLLGVPRRRDVKAALRCRLVPPSSGSNQRRLEGINWDAVQASHAFKQAKESSGWVLLCKRSVLEASGAIKDDSFTVECTITVIAEQADRKPADVLLPSSSLDHHLGELLRNGTGADVHFVVSGVFFAAHKAILASRSPVFMAQFFGRMAEEENPEEAIQIEDMEPVIFRAMLHFIYTDSSPMPDDGQDCTVVAQHLLAAADRYGLDRLKLMCEYKLYDGISVNTAATTLALAEQHNCLHLKARCVELIAANLDAVMATEGYRHLMASCPMIMNDLLKAVRGRNH